MIKTLCSRTGDWSPQVPDCVGKLHAVCTSSILVFVVWSMSEILTSLLRHYFHQPRNFEANQRFYIMFSTAAQGVYVINELRLVAKTTVKRLCRRLKRTQVNLLCLSRNYMAIFIFLIMSLLFAVCVSVLISDSYVLDSEFVLICSRSRVLWPRCLLLNSLLLVLIFALVKPQGQSQDQELDPEWPWVVISFQTRFSCQQFYTQRARLSKTMVWTVLWKVENINPFYLLQKYICQWRWFLAI